MPQVVKSNLLLYADGSCLMYQHKDTTKIEKILNEDFENIFDWFVDSKLSVHFWDHKTNFFESMQSAKNCCKLNIRYKEINIKQRAQLT